MIKAIFFDVDGTLVSHTKGGIPESAIYALNKLREKGIKLFISTGRHKTELKNLPVNVFDFDGYVTVNGQYCYDFNGNVIHSCPINNDDIKNIIGIFRDKKIPMTFVEEDKIYINFSNDNVERIQKSISSPVPEIGEYIENTPVYQVMVYDIDENTNYVASKMINCITKSWNDDAIDIIPNNGGKDIGIKNVIDYYGISQEEIMAFGDGENDATMLKFAHIGVAIGNAREITKSQSDYVTSHIDEDGILNALKHFNII